VPSLVPAWDAHRIATPTAVGDAPALRAEDHTVREAHNEQFVMLYAFAKPAELHDMYPREHTGFTSEATTKFAGDMYAAILESKAYYERAKLRSTVILEWL
jgi:hypothetical protein